MGRTVPPSTVSEVFLLEETFTKSTEALFEGDRFPFSSQVHIKFPTSRTSRCQVSMSSSLYRVFPTICRGSVLIRNAGGKRVYTLERPRAITLSYCKFPYCSSPNLAQTPPTLKSVSKGFGKHLPVVSNKLGVAGVSLSC